MKYIDEFRDGDGARHIAANIAAEVRPDVAYNFMEFCGGHTHAISRYGIADMLPANVRMIHGPGCPVCVLPIGRVDLAIRLALERGVMLCTYGDTMRVPASDGLSLIKAKARGADIRMVYSASDALKLAEQNPDREVVFFCHRLRDHHAANGPGHSRCGSARRQKLQRAVLPCADPVRHHPHPGVGRGAPSGHRAD